MKSPKNTRSDLSFSFNIARRARADDSSIDSFIGSRTHERQPEKSRAPQPSNKGSCRRKRYNMSKTEYAQHLCGNSYFFDPKD